MGTGGSSLFWNKLSSLGSASTPSISRSIPTTSRSLLWLLLRCSPLLPTPPDDHQPPAPLLLGRHPGLRHLLLHHRLPLLPLQPPASSSSPRSTWCSPPLSSACPCHRARRPPALLRHLLPPSCLRPLPPPALPAQAACSRPAPGRPCWLGCPFHWVQRSLEPKCEL